MTTTKERVILVAVQKDQDDLDFEYALKEMEQLVETAQGQVVGTLTQKRERLDGRTVIGKGKVQELAILVEELEPDLIIFYQSLTGAVARNLQEEISVRIIDRVQLILDIFAMRAKSKEGKLQVQLAQLNYLLPRLSGQYASLSRLGGGIGTRGPGETKLESDRRHIRNQIHDIEAQLKETEDHRLRAREKRQKGYSFQFGLIGYTNAGKSTTINQLTDADTFEEDQLFATLDPLTRKMDISQPFEVTVTDTVGFIQDLPTTLIHAFKSTLEESKSVDMLIHLVDASDPHFLAHEKTVLHLLEDLGMEKIPRITVYNKMDLAPANFQPNEYPNIKISALNPQDIERLKDFMLTEMKEVMLPFHLELESYQSHELYQLQHQAYIEKMDFNEDNNTYQVSGYSKRDFSKKLEED